MSTTTKNYGLEKPDGIDKYSIGVFNSNTDIIDEKIKINETAIETKQPRVTGALEDILNSNLPLNRVTVSSADGKLITSKVTVTELECVSGVTSNIQTQLDNKALKTHNHDDRYYTETEIDELLEGKANKSHSHNDLYYTESEVNNLLKGKLDSNANAVSATKASQDGSGKVIADTYATKSMVANEYATKSELTSGLSGKANNSHSHNDLYYTEGEVDDLLKGKLSTTGNAASATKDSSGNTIVDTYATKTELNTGLSGKAASSHTHDDRYYTESEITTLLANKQNKITISTSMPSGGSDGDLWAVIE